MSRPSAVLRHRTPIRPSASRASATVAASGRAR